MSSKSPLKIVFQSMDGVGHLNACIGLAQSLAKRGHQIYFITNATFSGTFEKFGFKEYYIRLENKEKKKQETNKNHSAHPMKTMLDVLKESGELSSKSPMEKMKIVNKDNKFIKMMFEELIEMTDQLNDIIQKDKPDLFILDYIFVHPSILYGNIPWVLSWSATPSMLYDSPDLPPIGSGYPTNDRSNWAEFNKVFDESMRACFRHFQTELIKHFGHDSIPNDSDHFFIRSPYLNIYCYPEELDYSDIIKIPENFCRIDSFCRILPGKFELPEEFKQKLKPDDKLIYLSMGSMGSIDVDLMKKLVRGLAQTPYKYIVSKGALHEQYDLADNMWGEAFLPQTSILPLVDMVITHGGNNTVTETFHFGKPMLVLPMFGDQPENAQRVTEKGYGLRLDTYNFTEQELIQSVHRILNDQEMILRCKRAGERIRKIDSKQNACERIEEIARKYSQK